MPNGTVFELQPIVLPPHKQVNRDCLFKGSRVLRPMLLCTCWSIYRAQWVSPLAKVIASTFMLPMKPLWLWSWHWKAYRVLYLRSVIFLVFIRKFLSRYCPSNRFDIGPPILTKNHEVVRLWHKQCGLRQTVC